MKAREAAAKRQNYQVNPELRARKAVAPVITVRYCTSNHSKLRVHHHARTMTLITQAIRKAHRWWRRSAADERNGAWRIEAAVALSVACGVFLPASFLRDGEEVQQQPDVLRATVH
ncbi:hypothetical protein HPB48_010671 [Haemaphysalis longicornis]|uniref:Uncharacterized protein n=1 Tax=Haemaphysalis longicornis TaxID=44386 RepID=A0A9J6G578_HAELO|nr:hypothetical protein HPB48_010671 [Haemaphysalis longicornis]